MEEKGEPYKVELINDLPEDAVISFYTQGEFTDLCAGPHLDTTGRIKGNAIKLTQCCGAYWRGDSKRKMLQRIYGVAFPKKEELDEYLQKQEEARKRDHNKLGRELEYFTTVDVIGQGLPILLPKGARVIQTAAALGRGRGGEARLSADQDAAAWPSASCIRSPATGITTSTACSSSATRTTRRRNASLCAR